MFVLAPEKIWTHWDLNPGPSACEADVIPLHHVPCAQVAARTLRMKSPPLGLFRPFNCFCYDFFRRPAMMCTRSCKEDMDYRID